VHFTDSGEYLFTVPGPADLAYHPGNAGQYDVVIDISSQRVDFPLNTFDLPQLEMGAIVVTEGTGVVRAATGKRKVIAFPLARGSNDFGSFKVHAKLNDL